MIKIVTKQYCLDILNKEYDLDLSLKNGQYYEFILNNRTYLAYAVREIPEGSFPTTLLIEQRGKSWRCLPSLLQIVENTSEINCNISQINNLTHGRPIDVSVNEGTYLVKDALGDIIALGLVSNNKLTPIVDIGGYLRYESD